MIAPTLQECYQRGVRPEATAMLPALFFVFMEQWHKGTLPYQYQDGILDAQAVHEMFEAQDPVAVLRPIKPCLVTWPTTRISWR
jgi:D-arabinitol 4-dehydrogenase